MVVRKRRGAKKAKKKDLGKVVTGALDNLTFLWNAAVRGPRMRALAALFFLVFVASMLVARQGTLRGRLGSGAIVLGAGAAVAALAWRERRIWQDPGEVIEKLAGRAMPEQAKRAQRALALLDDSGEPKDDGVSPVLTRLHVARALASIPQDRIAEEAGRVARRFGLAAIALVAASIVAMAFEPWGVVEGFDISLATGGVAPMGMRWLDSPEVSARPPDYLHEAERTSSMYERVKLPRGTVLTFRGAPTHARRKLALTDGTSEVPFVDDGTGKVVARWPLEGSADLRVVARFGDVRINDPDATSVTSIADLAPTVVLEGAPKQYRLTDGIAEIPVRYEARDDHGLREVQLVFKSGAREERRVLAKLDGEQLTDRGGYTIKATDSFFKKSHAPVEITVEAKDNDPVTGPKWGVSQPFSVIPPDVAEPAAKRADGLRALRDAYVDALAHRLGKDVPEGAADRKALAQDERAEQASNAALLEKTLTDSYAGVTVAARLRALLRAQAKKLDTALVAESASMTVATHASVVKATETMVLVVDGVLRGQSLRDAREASKQLADVADDLALGAEQMQHDSEADRGALRLNAATTVLKGGETQMESLGALGRDLAGAIRADLLRTERARTATDWPHAELAARDLAARLREPDPSFGAKGSGGGHASGESGTSPSGGESGGDEGEGEAERAFNEAAQELESLAQDHAGEMGEVEQALNRATSEQDTSDMKRDAKEHAKAVRDATKDMPSIGGGSDSWTSKGAAARELSEQMARALEDGNPADAVQSGRSAIQALDEAKRIAAHERYFDDDARGADKRLEDAKKKLEPEVKWAEEQQEALRKKAAQRAQGDLQKGGENEGKLADRADKLRTKARDQGSLPEPAIDALEEAEQAAREAARALQRGDADEAMKHQRDAQQKLEQANQALGKEESADDDGKPHGSSADDGNVDPSDHTDIPNANAHKGPEDFRRRVIKGLAQPGSARQKDAIKRYAEGLLR